MLAYRVVMAALTRFRADENYVTLNVSWSLNLGSAMATHPDLRAFHYLADEYYSQRATRGGLIVTEATRRSWRTGSQVSSCDELHNGRKF